MSTSNIGTRGAALEGISAILICRFININFFFSTVQELWSHGLLQQQLRENMTQHSLVIPGYLITAHDWSLMNLLHPYLVIQ